MKILVVEAEDAVREIMGVMLKRLGYKASLTSNCDDAFRTYCDDGPFDVVLIGMKFMRRSRAGGTGSPVLRKPFTLQDLDDFMGAFRRPANSRFG